MRGDGVVGWARRNPLFVDVAVAAVLTGLHLATLAAWETGTDTGYRPMDPFAYGLAVVTSGSVALRRRFPMAVLVAIVGSVVVLAIGEYPWGNTVLPTSLAVYSVGATCARRRVVLAGGLLVAGLVVIRVSSPPEFDTAVLGANLVFGLGVLYVGWTVQVRRRQAALLEERNRELGAAREQLAAQVVSAERLRLARELHDVVAHSMSVIAVQAGAGRHVLRTDPDEADYALGAIEATSRDALAEMRRMVGVLRHDGQRIDDSDPDRGLSDLARLVDEIAKAGLPTTLTVDGTRPVEIPAALGLTAYRITQEALTNAMKYAGPARAVVRVCWGPHDVVVEVCDDGAGAAVTSGSERDTGGGHGVAGMRERVALLGGELTAGPALGGGFRVAARLPYNGPGASTG